MTHEREPETIPESGLDSNEPTDTDAPRHGVTWKRVASAIVSLVVIVAIFYFVIPLIADYDEVFATIRAMTTSEITSLVLIGLWNLVTYWFVIVAALPGLRLREAAVVNQASTAVSNTLPAGGALGVGITLAMLTSWGFTIAAITRSAVVTGIWNNFVKLGMPVLALALLALEGGITPARLTAAAIGIAVLIAAVVVLWMVLKSDRLARAIGRFVGKIVDWFRGRFRNEPLGDWDGRAAKFRLDTVGLLEHRWLPLTLATLLSHISLYLVLLVALRHVGVSQEELSWIAVLAAYSFVRLISMVPITPGGVGVVELGYAATLTIGLDDMARARVVAAILVFRAITYLLPIPLGIASYVIWRVNNTWRMTDEERAQLAGDAYDVEAAPPT